MGRIEYRPPAATPGVELLSIRGTVPADRLKTLSSQPFVILPAGTFGVNDIFIPFSLSIVLIEIVPLAAAIQLTFDLAVSPFLEVVPVIPGGGMITAAPIPWLFNFEQGFNVNNINTNAAGTDLVFKAIVDSPGADLNPAPFELIYAVRSQLT